MMHPRMCLEIFLARVSASGTIVVPLVFIFFFFQDCRKLSVCSMDSVSYLVLLAEVCRSANGNCQAVIAGSRLRALGRSRQKST
jgi:hypothetical protein